MSAAHMGMVFAAAGLDGTEKLLLLGYTNYTDPHGYCWPSEERLADDCGTSRSTVQRGKRKLVRRNLIKSARRTNPRTLEPISNLTRVNLPLLASMARTKADYDDDLINAITFDDDTQGDPFSSLPGTPENPEPTSDLLMSHSDSYPESNRLVPRVILTPTPGQSDSQSLSDPVVIQEPDPAAPSARSAGDGRRPTTGSRPRAAGGSAASSKKAAAPGKGFTAVERTAVRAVLVEVGKVLPASFMEQLPTNTPPNVSRTILDALGKGTAHERTAAQLAARAMHRWDHHGYGSKAGAGEIESEVGALVAMVRRPPKSDDECPNPRCENGHDVDTSADCNVHPGWEDDKQRKRAAAARTVAAEVPAADYYPVAPEPGSGTPPSWAIPQQAQAGQEYSSPCCAQCRVRMQTTSRKLCRDCQDDAEHQLAGTGR